MNINPANGNPPLPPQPPVSPAAAPRSPALAEQPHEDEEGASSSARQPRSPLQGERRGIRICIGNQDALDAGGFSVLHRAVIAADAAQVVILLRLGANPNLLSSNQRTPLILAAERGAHDVIRVLLKVPTLQRNARGESDATALHCAARHGHLASVRLLLDAQCDPHAVMHGGLTALHLAAAAGHVQAVQSLASAMPGRCADQSSTGYGAFHLAAHFGFADVVSALASVPEFDINQKTARGDTALHVAVEAGTTQVVRALLAMPGIDVNAHGYRGACALQAAAGLGHTHIVAALLADPRIDPNVADDLGSGAIHLAVRQGKHAVLGLLLGAPDLDINLADLAGHTALFYCSPSASASGVAKVDTALALLGHPDIDPNGAFELVQVSPRVVAHFREEAGAAPDLPDAVFLRQELERWANFVPPRGLPNRFLTSLTNAILGKLLYQSELLAPVPPDPNRKDAAFRLALALEQGLQFFGGYNPVLRRLASDLLHVVSPDPTPAEAARGPDDRDHRQFLIHGIFVPRSEIEDMAHARGNYVMHGDMQAIAQGWAANVHLPGFLLRGSDILARLKARDTAALTTRQAFNDARAPMDAQMAQYPEGMQIIRQVLATQRDGGESSRGPRISDEEITAVAQHIAALAPGPRAQARGAWRAYLMRDGLYHAMSQNGAVNEGGLETSSQETLRLMQSYIRSLASQPGKEEVAHQLQGAVLERLHDIGSEPGVCNTGCVQRLLDAPAGIDASLMSREPGDESIFNEILTIGAAVSQALDRRYCEGTYARRPAPGELPGSQPELELTSTVRNEVLSATVVDDLIRRRGWSRPKVEEQLDKVLVALGTD